MFIGLSWWVLGLAAALSAPVWLRVLVQRWEKQALERTERLLAAKQEDPVHDGPEDSTGGS